jgi:hypothetical protein
VPGEAAQQFPGRDFPKPSRRVVPAAHQQFPVGVEGEPGNRVSVSVNPPRFTPWSELFLRQQRAT